MNAFAKTAMVLSLLYYLFGLLVVWVGLYFGWSAGVWDMFDMPERAAPPAAVGIVFGLVMSWGAYFALASVYGAVWRILNGGRQQDFRQLAIHLRRIGLGLIAFWLTYNLLAAIGPHLIVMGSDVSSDTPIEYDLLDIEIVMPILGIAMLAIAGTLGRAADAEEENRQFL